MSESEPLAFASVLRTARVALGSTQAQIASKAGLTPSYLSMLENGRKPPPSERVLRRLARALEMEEASLLEIAQLERSPAPLRKRVADLRKSLDVERRISRRVLRGVFPEVLWRFLMRRGFAHEAIDTLRLSRRTRGLLRTVVRDPGRTRTLDEFKRESEETIDELDADAQEDLVDAVSELTESTSATDSEPSRGDEDSRASNDDRTYWHRVTDQEMYPRIEAGDRVLLDPTTKPENGSVVAARSGDRTILRIHQLVAGTVELRAANPTIPPMRLDEEGRDGATGDEVEVVAVAVRMERGLA